ncbi:type II secretion system secretin GspD [Methylophilus sp. 3sh_L]|uniref:type II secretion system secretin GspD n=1 Tax=Methylophilus sp. 3sh_L TaxID=3377114 RepID=UPI00398EB619
MNTTVHSTSFKIRHLLSTLVLLITLDSSISCGALDSKTNLDDSVSLSFVNADINVVIQAISQISGRNFIVDPRVKGTLNIVTTKPVTHNMSYSILLSALRLQGYAAIEGEGITKIVPEVDAKLHAVPVGKSRSGDRLLTQIFNLKNESATQLLPIIRPLVSPNNTVAAYQGNNSIVVTDYADNIERISQIIESIDLPQGNMRIIPLKHASALDLAQTVTRLLSDASFGGVGAGVTSGVIGDSSQRVSVIGDPRTNSLLVRSDNASKINAVRQLVTNLDLPGASGNIHVVYLKNAEAIKLAQTLRSLMSNDNVMGAETSSNQISMSQPVGAGNALGTGGVIGSATNTTSTTTSFSGNNSNNNSFSGQSFIQADSNTNSLIITAPEVVYNNIRKVIDQLDKRRAQVYVEALITEVSTEKAAEIGIQWLAAKSGSTSLIGGTNFNTGGNNLLTLASGLTSSTSSALPGTGLNLILGGGTVSIAGREIANLNLLARFLESDSKANILSTPNLITLDNEEAKIVVGSNLPFVTGSYATTGGNTTTSPFTTVERKDVGLTLRVKPQISEGGTVRLQIYQEASAVIDSTVTAVNGPSTTKRSIESTVLVDDGSVIALGGLVEDTFNGGMQKVPLLGDLPGVGSLFRYSTRKRGKTNLIVFLRPVILRDAASLNSISADRYEYVIGQQRAIEKADDLMRGEPSTPQLPPKSTPAPTVPYYPDSQPVPEANGPISHTQVK